MRVGRLVGVVQEALAPGSERKWWWFMYGMMKNQLMVLRWVVVVVAY